MMFCAAQDDALILYQDSLVLVISLMGCSIGTPLPPLKEGGGKTKSKERDFLMKLECFVQE
jgi:hypothetical protein